MTPNDEITPDWPQRAWVLAGLGAAIGVAIHFLTRGDAAFRVTENTTRLAFAAFLAVGGFAFAVTVERTKIHWSAVFAVVVGFVVASVFYWSGTWDNAEIWRFACAALTVAIAAPLFQAWRDGREQGGSSIRHIPYVEAHNHAWTNVVLWFAAWAFVGIVWALALLLAELFKLIGISFLSELLRHGWFAIAMTGAALGGSIGILRDRARILGTLQRVVTTVLSVLAPVLAVGLALFLIALPFTGLAPLWSATKATTPILIGCVIGALILTNAVIGDRTEDEARLKLLRWSAMVLALAMLPLAIIASVSTGLRIAQYGLTPERLWAVVFVAIACAHGLAYLVSLVRGRAGWAAYVRPANMRLAVGLCVLAFILSTPVVSFGALSTNDQVARLVSGRTPVEKFDWAALRFDFGPHGKAAVERLAKTGATPVIRTAAAAALKTDNRYQAADLQTRLTLESRLTVLPQRVALPDELKERLISYGPCSRTERCAVIYRSGANEAIVVSATTAIKFTFNGKRWDQHHPYEGQPGEIEARLKGEIEAQEAQLKRVAAALARNQVEVREVKQRQVFVGGEPVGGVFE